MAHSAIAGWFDELEGILTRESRLAGLLEHDATVGQAREFLTARVLKTFLPSSVHIGSGKVIDSSGKSSKQIDIIIYDPRFPAMKTEGGGIYFIEGVLASIEVKSIMDSEKLKLSLDNCKSVLELNPHGEHAHEAEARIQFYMERGNLDHNAAEHRFWYMFRPATYIFSFDSRMSIDLTASTIGTWWQSVGCACSTYFPLFPRVITTGKAVGFTNDGRITLKTADGRTDYVMGVFGTELKFRWLAIHLMDAVNLRLGLRNFAESFDYRLSDYYPFEEYVAAIGNADTKFIARQDGPTTT